MGKKCIPGLFCVENMTLFMLFVVFTMVMYLYAQMLRSGDGLFGTKVVVVSANSLGSHAYPADYDGPDIFNDARVPPLKMEDSRLRTMPSSAPPRGSSAINVRTRPSSSNEEYSQLGILTRKSRGEDGDKIILPLFGRNSDTSRDKHQYYTMSNTGSVSTKLPVSVSGKSCTSERGCDEIISGDMVYVEGYGNVFKATVYENALYRYLPF